MSSFFKIDFMSLPLLESSNTLNDEPNFTGSPERMLLLAMLERAILDFVGNDRKEALAAEEWIFSDEDSPLAEPFSFAWVCKELDLSPSSVAQMIKAMPKRGSQRIAPWYFTRKSSENKSPVLN